MSSAHEVFTQYMSTDVTEDGATFWSISSLFFIMACVNRAEVKFTTDFGKQMKNACKNDREILNSHPAVFVKTAYMFLTGN